MKSFINIILIFIFISFPVYTEEDHPNIQLRSSVSESTTGYFHIYWDSDNLKEEDVSIYEKYVPFSTSKEDSNFKKIYRSKWNSLSLSGKKDGFYYYIVQSENNKSNIIKVKVKHHNLFLSFLIFFSGLILFVILIFYIIIQDKKLKN